MYLIQMDSLFTQTALSSSVVTVS